MNPENRVPNPNSRRMYNVRRAFVAGVAGASALTGAFADRMISHDAHPARNPASTPTEAESTATTMVAVPDNNPTLTGVAESVHDGEIRGVIDDLQKLNGGSTIVQPNQEVAVPVRDINRDLNK